MRDYSDFLDYKKSQIKRGVSVNRDIDWWVSYIFRKSSKVFFLFAIILIVSFIIYLKNIATSNKTFPLEQIKITGNILITTKKHVSETFNKFNDKSFLDIDLNEVSKSLETLKWIEKVNIIRQWPSTLQVNITERKPSMRWGDNELIDENGNKFANTNSNIFINLPKLSGPDGYEKEVIKYYYQYANLFGGEMEMTEFSLSEALSWQVSLNNGVIIKFGRERFKARLELLRNAHKAEKIPDLDKIEVIDLRAPSGFVIKWKPEFIEKESNSKDKTINVSLEKSI